MRGVSELWPQLPEEWESYHLVLELEEVLRYSGWSRPGRPVDVSEGVAFILNRGLKLYWASMKYNITCTGAGGSYSLWAAFAGGVAGGQFTYPRVHMVPRSMRVVPVEGGSCLLVRLDGHIDKEEHRSERSSEGWEKSERVLRSLHYWSRCYFLGLELPPVRSAAELLGFDPPNPNGSD